jgi:hypothetical protein
MAPGAARADINYELDFVFENGGGAWPNYGTSPPAITAIFSNDPLGTPGAVYLTLETFFADFPTTFVSTWNFNFDPQLDTRLAALNFEVVDGSKAWNDDDIDITISEDGIPADGGGRYDISIEFPTGGGPNNLRLNGDNYITFLITAPGLVEDDFNFLATPHGSHGIYYTSAHIQGGFQGGSFWVGDGSSTPPGGGQGPLVPAPATIWLLAMGGIGMGAWTWRRPRRS